MPTPPRASWRPSRDRGPEPHLARLQELVGQGHTLTEAAAKVGIPRWLAKAEFVRSGLAVPRPTSGRRRAVQVRRRLARSEPPNASDFAVLLALRLLAHTLGAERSARGPVHVSMGDWESRRDPAQHPSAVAVTARFGGWNLACELAGVPQRPVARKSGAPRRWTDQECLDAVREFLAQASDGNAGSRYQEWAAARAVPSLATVSARFGGWPKARAAARVIR